MNQEKLLFFYGLLVAVLVFMFLRLKFRRERPTSLNLRKTRPVSSKAVDVSGEEELNIYFKFNDQMWDAYEVIGVPAGSSMAEIERAYSQRRPKNRKDKELLERAYGVIRKKETLDCS